MVGAKDIKALYELLFEGIQEDISALREENQALREEVVKLREKLKTREEITFDGSAYWVGNEGPYCQRCYDVEDRLVRLQGHQRQWACKSCESCYDKRTGGSGEDPPSDKSP